MTEPDAVAQLEQLNAGYIRAFVESDAAWYDEHLAADFTCTLADGKRIDKAAFLERAAERPDRDNLICDGIDIRPLGDVALVHGTTHYTLDGKPGSTSYTDVWHLRDGRWLAVAAQLTRVA
jgi:ketosteroid isomerase-like protein